MLKRLIKNSYFWVALLMLAITLIMTFPLIFEMNRYIPGFSSTDEPYGSIWYWWWLKFSLLNQLNPLSCGYLAAPTGIAIPFSMYPIWTAIVLIINFLSNEIFTYNLQVISSFVLAGVFMYTLVYYISRNKAISIFSGIIYAFSPYHFVRSWQHLGLSQIQFLPLFLLALLKLIERPRLGRIILVGLCFFLVASFDFYYAYFAGVSSLALIIFLLLRRNFLKKTAVVRGVFFALLLGGALTLITLLPIKMMVISGYINPDASAWSVRKPFEDLFGQSARPLSYLIPPSTHPVFGAFSEGFIGTQAYGESMTEHTLYLGWTPLILAFYFLKKRRKGRKRQGAVAGSDAGDLYIDYFVFLGIIAWLFSQPPWWQIGPIRLYMPSFFMYKIFPMFRAYCRFGVVVLLCVALLGGVGLGLILKKLRDFRFRGFILGALCILVLFEFWNWPPYKVIDLSVIPKAYYWLRDQPADLIIAEYPLDVDSPNEIYKFYQTLHEKRMINGSIPGSDENRESHKLLKLSSPTTAAALGNLGVRYIFVHQQGYLDTGLIKEIKEFEGIGNNRNLELIKIYPPEACREGIMCLTDKETIYLYQLRGSLHGED